jgi:hypothetical protein
LDGDMLVLRQAGSRRCGRAIVDVDAGCKCLAQEMGVPWCVYAQCTRPTAVLRSTAASDRRRERRWGIVEMKLVVSSLRGRRKQC